MPREIIMEIPMSQISGSPKELSASLMATVAGFLIGLPSGSSSGTVTLVMATSIMARIDSAPMGMALPMMAAITPTNSANRCQALGVTPCGTGMTNQINSVSTTATAIGMGLNPSLLSISYSLIQVDESTATNELSSAF